MATPECQVALPARAMAVPIGSVPSVDWRRSTRRRPRDGPAGTAVRAQPPRAGGARSHRPVRQPGWLVAKVAGRQAAELVARGDVELQEDLAQVVLDRAGADEQLCADLRVGETVSGEPSDVCLLGCEHAARVVLALPRRFTRGQELVPGPVGKPFGPDAAEHLVGGSELLARVDAPVLATQPFAVQKPGAGEVDHATAARKPLDRLAVERLRGSSVAHQRA